jgi:hypothetical protein
VTRARPRRIDPARRALALPERSGRVLNCGVLVAIGALLSACQTTDPQTAAPQITASQSEAPHAEVGRVSAASSPAAPPSEPPAARKQDEPREVRVKAEGQLGPGGGVLLIDLAPPAGAKLNEEAPLSAKGSGGIGLEFPERLSGPLGGQRLPLRLPIEVADGATGPAQVDLTYYWCTDGNEAACRREQTRLSVDLDLSGSGAGGEAILSYRSRGDEG